MSKNILVAGILVNIMMLSVYNQCVFSQWVTSDGIYGGASYAVLKKDNYVYSASDYGIKISSNGGNNWLTVLHNVGFNAIAYDSGCIYAGGTGLFKTTNQGLNWIQLSSTGGGSILSLFFYSGKMFAGSYGGVYMSTNGGLNWVLKQSADRIYTIDTIGGYLLAGGYHTGVFYSTNGGENWSVSYPGGNAESINTLKSDGSTLFAGSYSNVWKSTNKGVNWTSTSLNEYTRSLVFQGNILFAACTGIYKTTNGGLTWSQTAALFSDQNVNTLYSDGSTLLAGTQYKGVFFSSNSGINWLQGCYNFATVQGMGVTPYGILASTDNWKIFKSTDNGANWSYLTNHSYYYQDIKYSQGVTYAATSNGIAKSTNDGVNWTITGLNGIYLKTLYVEGNLVLAGTFMNGLYVSTNSGINWVQSNITNQGIFSIIKSGNYLVAGGSTSGIYISSDNGLTWVQTFNAGSCLAIDSMGSKLFAAGGLGVHVSSNNGQNWATVSSFPTSIKSMVISNNTIFVSNYDYCYASSNEGITWFNISQGLEFPSRISKLFISGNYLLSIPDKYSIWRRNLSEIQLPITPSLIFPANGSVSVDPSLNLVWSKSVTAVKYNVMLSADSLFNTIILNDTLVTDTLKNINGLAPLTNYYWKVRSKNSIGWSVFSGVYRFKTVGVPFQTVLFSPSDNSVNQSVALNLVWRKPNEQSIKSFHKNKNLSGEHKNSITTVSKYWLEVGTDSLFANVVLRDTTLTDTLKYITGLNNSTKYYWRVKSKNQAGWGAYSEVWKFTTIPPVPQQPVLISPPDNATNMSPDVLLDWQPSDYAVSYRIQLSADSIFTSVVFDTSGVVCDSLRMIPGILLPNGRYYWRVNAINITGTGPWSIVWKFRINPTGIPEVISVMPDEFRMFQNYPNPFNPVTKILYSIPNTCFVNLKVYDALGREVSVLVNEIKKEGNYYMDFNSSGLPSGVYFYKITAGDFYSVRKMVITK